MPTTHGSYRKGWLVAALVLAAALPGSAAPADAPPPSPWSIAVAGGLLDSEGDEPIENAPMEAVRLGYSRDENWSIEGVWELVPDIEESFRTDWRDGARISQLEEEAGAGVHDTWSMRFAVELLRHLYPRAQVSPFLAAGIGYAWYADGFPEESEPLLLGGAGCLVRLNDNWALRGDVRAVFTGTDTECNGTYLAGLQWTPGRRSASALAVGTVVAAVPPTTPDVAPAPAPAPAIDTDRDGLTDDSERGVHHTDPLRADTDWDALSDGDEVNKYGTDPLKRDTDGGRVYDGHEVMEDGTDAKRADDDLTVYELRLGFDPEDWHIKSEYFSEIGVIGKTLKDNPGATARIEGHVDAYTIKGKKAGVRLSERRAEAVVEALVRDWGIAAESLKATGYGASRPQGASEPPKGNADNERIEVYIRMPAPLKAP